MDFANLKNCMEMFLERDHVPGLHCKVYKGHEEVFDYYAGASDREAGKPMQGNEIYRIYSMTKMITCISALQLMEKNKFLLNDQVSMYFPEFEKMRIAETECGGNELETIATGTGGATFTSTESEHYAKTPLTIRHLFTMSSGLDYNKKTPAILKAISEGRTSTSEIAREFSKTILGFEPGTRYRYCLGLDVLGALIELWSGMTLGEYMDKNIFTPLGMKDTFFGLPESGERKERLATLYKKGEDGLPERTDFALPGITEGYESGSGGLCSCAEDYITFLDALACGGVGKNGKRIISQASIELMKTDHTAGMDTSMLTKSMPGYGFGLGIRTHIDKTQSGALSPLGEFGWDGSGGGFSLVDTENELSLVYFQHYSGWQRRTRYEMTNALYSCID